jgi:hypothetical protein
MDIAYTIGIDAEGNTHPLYCGPDFSAADAAGAAVIKGAGGMVRAIVYRNPLPARRYIATISPPAEEPAIEPAPAPAGKKKG